MKLYHGSNVVVAVPDLTKSKPYKDFGRGFYLSADKSQAMRMAEQKTLQLMMASLSYRNSNLMKHCCNVMN